MLDIDWGQAILLAVLLLGTGVVAGVIAGLLGVGGGIVIVPVLYHVFSFVGVDEAVRMHVAVGTSLATIIPTSISSLRAHRRRGSVDVDLLKSWGPAIAVGVIIGAAIAGSVQGITLTAVFAIVALLVALNMAFRPENFAIADQLPRTPWKQSVGGGIGVFSVMMGIGGGTLSVPILTAFRFPIRLAVGTAAAIGLIIAVPGALGAILFGWGTENLPPFSIGYVNVVGFLLIVPATVLTAPIGARIAHAIPQRGLRYCFALFLAITSIRMGFDIFG